MYEVHTIICGEKCMWYREGLTAMHDDMKCTTHCR